MSHIQEFGYSSLMAAYEVPDDFVATGSLLSGCDDAERQQQPRTRLLGRMGLEPIQPIPPATISLPKHRDPVGFAGQQGCYADLETGLVLMDHRYYDPGTGRFLTPLAVETA